MFTGTDQLTRSSVEFMKLGARGVTAFAASGDGGSHFSFQKFPSDPIGNALNQVGCAVNFPTYPASDPYVTGVGGTQYNGSKGRYTSLCLLIAVFLLIVFFPWLARDRPCPACALGCQRWRILLDLPATHLPSSRRHVLLEAHPSTACNCLQCLQPCLPW